MLLCLSLCFRVTNSIVVNVPTYSLFTCMWIPYNCSHCENGSFEVLSLHFSPDASGTAQTFWDYCVWLIGRGHIQGFKQVCAWVGVCVVRVLAMCYAYALWFFVSCSRWDQRDTQCKTERRTPQDKTTLRQSQRQTDNAWCLCSVWSRCARVRAYNSRRYQQ